ncbi:MAG: hypothetical protein HY248_00555, partial [Fimbriimonas ginsengisoli]|nr:hypothetical protein [Fimbriimonas ginsengisoli]
PVWDGSAPRLLALAQFKPTRIGGEPAEGQLAVRPGEETDNAGAIGPDVYLTRFAGWANQIIRTYPDGWDRTDANKDRYLVGRTDPTGALQGYHLYSYSPATDGSESTGGMEVFDLNAYAMTVHDGGAYPFTAALQAANGRSNWLAAANVAALKKTFEPYSPDAAAGKAVASFAISEVGDKTLTPPGNDPNNLPVIDTGLALSPLQDTGAGQPYSGAGYQINGCFNRVWNENPGLRPDIQRFVDLRVTPQGDGTGGPMDVATGFPRACVVPGSEEVFGPDQLAGLNFGQPVRYIRTTNSPGPNQYRINYVDQIEPTDYTLLGVPPPPATYDPTDLTSAVIQPRYKAGYIQLNSDPNSPLPVGTLQIYYRFQFTRPRDVFEVDYDTRQEMSILMTVRAYPSSSSFNAQSVTVPATAKVRNLLR